MGRYAIAALILGVGAGLILTGADAQGVSEQLASVTLHAPTSSPHWVAMELSKPSASSGNAEVPGGRYVRRASTGTQLHELLRSGAIGSRTVPAVRRIPSGFVPDRNTAPPSGS